MTHTFITKRIFRNIVRTRTGLEIKLMRSKVKHARALASWKESLFNHLLYAG